MTEHTNADVILCEARYHQNVATGFVLPKELRGKQSLGARHRAIREIAERSLLFLNPKKAKDYPELNKHDKIFASCWLDSTTVALGTKDNKLLLWNIVSDEHKSITIPEIGSPVPQDTCGIHDIDLNPSKYLLATGGHSPLDILIFSRDTMTPTSILKGHSDWVFSAKFIEDEFLVSASRDSTVALWRVGDPATVAEGGGLTEVTPLLTRKEHATKVRALEYHHYKKQIVTVSTDSMVKIWDRSNMDVVASFEFAQYPEMVCTAVDETYDICAVGSQRGVCILDMRGPLHAMTISYSVGNRQWGIRSIEFFHHFLSIGGGFGRLAFFDLRNKSFLEMPDGKKALKTGEGWVDPASHFSVRGIHHAIYSHKFNPLGGQLLVTGGPIMLGAKGCYASLW